MIATTRRSWMGGLLAAAVTLAWAGGAAAAPMEYVFVSGQIRVEASTGGQVLGLSDLETLDGFSVVIDTDATGAGNGGLVSMLLSSGGPVDFALDPAYAEYDYMSLSDITLSGSGDLNLITSGPPELYTYIADPLELSATLDADDFEDVAADITGMAIQSITTGSGFISLDTVNSALFLQGVTIGTLTLGDADPLVLKADLMFMGEGVIPEPDGARLMAVGVLLVGLFGLGRRSFAR